jgi:hypothetical protein
VSFACFHFPVSSFGLIESVSLSRATVAASGHLFVMSM